MDESLPQTPEDPTERGFHVPADGRFHILRLLGAGGMGVVYEVFDRERNCRVALKTLRKMSPTALYRFKQEFRSLAQITHPGLAQLYELISDGADWFFTLELVEGGVDLMTYLTEAAENLGEPNCPAEHSEADQVTPRLHPPDSRDSLGAETGTAMRPSRLGTLGPGANSTAPPGDLPCAVARDARAVDVLPPPFPGRPVTDHERLRRTLSQLAEAVSALHAHGKLHRDIKPSNALVTPEGRVVLLDFGLIVEVQRPGPAVESGTSGPTPQRAGGGSDGGLWRQAISQSGLIVGTVNYMSPEQAAGEALGEASDWYAVGVILYRALTGRLPHRGHPGIVLEAKRTRPPEDPGLLAPERPPTWWRSAGTC